MAVKFNAAKSIQEITNEIKERRDIYTIKNLYQYFCVSIHFYQMSRLQNRFRKHQKKSKVLLENIREDLEIRAAEIFAEGVIKEFQKD